MEYLCKECGVTCYVKNMDEIIDREKLCDVHYYKLHPMEIDNVTVTKKKRIGAVKCTSCQEVSIGHPENCYSCGKDTVVGVYYYADSDTKILRSYTKEANDYMENNQ